MRIDCLPFLANGIQRIAGAAEAYAAWLRSPAMALTGRRRLTEETPELAK